MPATAAGQGDRQSPSYRDLSFWDSRRIQLICEMSRRRPPPTSSSVMAQAKDEAQSPLIPEPTTPLKAADTSWAMRAVRAAALWVYVPPAKAQAAAPQTSEDSSYITEQYNICKDDIGACSGLISECQADGHVTRSRSIFVVRR